MSSGIESLPDWNSKLSLAFYWAGLLHLFKGSGVPSVIKFVTRYSHIGSAGKTSGRMFLKLIYRLYDLF